MRDPFHKSKSAEQFSAWLDGNLPIEEMRSFSKDVSEDYELQQIAKMSDIVDDDIAAFEASDEKLPIELNNDYFALPDLDRPYDLRSHLVGACMDACCCATPPEIEDEGLFEKLRKMFDLEEGDINS